MDADSDDAIIGVVVGCTAGKGRRPDPSGPVPGSSPVDPLSLVGRYRRPCPDSRSRPRVPLLGRRVDRRPRHVRSVHRRRALAEYVGDSEGFTVVVALLGYVTALLLWAAPVIATEWHYAVVIAVVVYRYRRRGE